MMPLSSKVSASGSSSAGEFVVFERGDDELTDEAGEVALERRDLFFDWAGAGAHLQGRAGEEAAAGERSPLKMIEERVAERDELSDARCGGEGGFDHLGLEDAPGFVDGRELQFLFGTEVGVHAALAHVEGAGEVTDREALESVDCRERYRLAHDRGAGPFAIRSFLARCHVDNIARSVVLCQM